MTPTATGRVRVARWRPAAFVALVGLGLGGSLVGPEAPLAEARPAGPERPLAAGRPVQASPDGSGDGAILDLVGCLQGTDRMAVVLLIDESTSLQGSDPDDQRVDAALAALDSLAALARGAGSDRTAVDVTVAAFADRYRTVRGWTGLRNGNRRRLDDALESFRARDTGTDTDIVNALTGARRALATRRAALTGRGAASPCQAVLLFTDGQYDVGVRTADDVDRLGLTKPYAPGVRLDDEAGVAEAERLGRAALCEPGGLADGLRGDEVTLLTVALAPGGAPSQDLLRAVTEGSSGSTTCGLPADATPGAYLAAGDVDVLIARFDEVASRVAGGTVVPAREAIVLCGLEPCRAGEATVRLDPSVRRLRLLALAPAPGLELELQGPAGIARVTAAGRGEVGGVSWSATEVAGRGLAIDLRRPDELAAWTGTWSVRLLDASGRQAGRPATLQRYVFSDLAVAFTEPPVLVRGRAGRLEAAVTLPPGVVADDVFDGAEATVRLDDVVDGSSRSVPLAGPSAGPYAVTFTPPADLTSSAYEASIELRATSSEGAELVVRSAPVVVPVARPEGSIQVAPAVLELPAAEGTGATRTDLTVTGGSGDGCIWFGSETTTGPEAAGVIEVRYDGRAAVRERGCLPVAAGRTRTVEISASAPEPASGTVRGVVEVWTEVDGATAEVTRVPLRFDLAPGIDEDRRTAIALAILAAGVAAPLLLLLAVNRATARFPDLDAMQAALIAVRVSDDDVLRLDGRRTTELALSRRDFRSLRAAGDARRFTFGGVTFRARPARHPFGSTEAVASPAGGAPVRRGGAGSRLTLDPGLAGSWLFLVDPDRTRDADGGVTEGNLLAFLASDDTGGQLGRLIADLEARLPATAAELGRLVRSDGTVPTAGGGATSAPTPPDRIAEDGWAQDPPDDDPDESPG